MAKATKKAGQAKNLQAAKASHPQNIHDALKAFMELAASLDEASDLDRAQDVAFDAMEAESRSERIALAKRALAISPLCADAHCILAGEAATRNERLALYRKAVEAGEQALGKAAFTEDVGSFWGLIETRPYMRALHGLAHTLWEHGERDQAIVHYREMLRLNPNDNQGIRYQLIHCFLERGLDDEANSLLKQYKNDSSAVWTWSGALLSFRKKGDIATSRKALAKAIETNSHVAPYLLGKKKLPRTLPQYIGWGDENEAVAYVHDANAIWRATEGGKLWVEAVLADKLSKN